MWSHIFSVMQSNPDSINWSSKKVWQAALQEIKETEGNTAASNISGEFWWRWAIWICQKERRKQGLEGDGSLAWLDPAGGEEVRVSLERAEIRRLRISQPIPAAIDIGHIQVDRWSLGLEHEGGYSSSDETRENYQRLLASAEPFRKSNYTAMERDLHDRGDAAIADQIRRDMKDRDRSDEESRLKILLYSIHASFGYGTQLEKIPVWIFRITFISWIFFQFGGHGFPDAVSHAVAVGVPIIGLAYGPRLEAESADEKKPADEKASSQSKQKASALIPQSVVQVWAWFASACCYVLWPLFLAGLLPRILGRRERSS